MKVPTGGTVLTAMSVMLLLCTACLCCCVLAEPPVCVVDTVADATALSSTAAAAAPGAALWLLLSLVDLGSPTAGRKQQSMGATACNRACLAGHTHVVPCASAAWQGPNLASLHMLLPATGRLQKQHEMAMQVGVLESNKVSYE